MGEQQNTPIFNESTEPVVGKNSAEFEDGLLKPKTKLVKALDIIEPCTLVLVPVLLLLLGYLGISSTALISAIVAVIALIPFFARFEAARPRPRDFMPIVVMAAFGVAGRLIFMPVPAIKPVTAIVIVTAISFGRQSGFLTGALIALVSNIFFGQGPWTPWQMYCWGLVGYLSAVFAQMGLLNKPPILIIWGFLASYLYGFILDTWTLLGFVEEINAATIATTYGGGAIYNLGHAIGTVVFLLPIAIPWSRKFERVKRKYGIGSV